jgi:hypothetical protein
LKTIEADGHPLATPIYGLSPAVLPRRRLRVAHRMLTLSAKGSAG